MESVEHSLVCPYCWQVITMVIEPLTEQQVYVEDCEMCCNPIQVTFWLDEEDGLEFSATDVGQ
jgi:hypothetical protein